MGRERWMAILFASGSVCFLVGPFPGYIDLVGPKADSITFFVGSILFTAGWALQTSLAFPERGSRGAGRAAWWAAVIQSCGTLFFNVTTFQAMDTQLSAPDYDRLSGGPMPSARSAFSSRARSPTAHPCGMAGCPRVGGPDGGSRP
jgi:hypothetical protein